MVSLEKAAMDNKVRSSGANLGSPSMPGFILLAKKSTDFFKKGNRKDGSNTSGRQICRGKHLR